MENQQHRQSLTCTVLLQKLRRSELPANDAMRRRHAPRPCLLLLVPVLRRCDAFVANFALFNYNKRDAGRYFAIANVQCQYDSSSDTEMEPEDGAVRTSTTDHTYDAEPPAVVIKQVHLPTASMFCFLFRVRSVLHSNTHFQLDSPQYNYRFKY
ncbi:hypothetical protein EVAR_59460_1 [Eumeta japonica]|uniref:Uncharacterized protein n=1 Tax=Eumeta variegata TaxID=151549 RepID=A0A4C1ZXW6_EUMVA|nr:hypothetical protein EVAR_59460_1 [Eumeta japonica]